LKVDYVEEGSSLRHLDIELPEESLSEEFDRGVDKLRRSVRLPGFRKGKIPKDVIRRRFHSDVLNQAVQDLVSKALNEAIREKKLYPLNDPSISKLESELGKPLRFRATFEVIPEIELKTYKGLEVEQPKTEVTDEHIDKGIESIREDNARFDPIEGRGARDHDFVVGNLTEKPQVGGKEEVHEGVSIEVGSNAYHETLHDKLQGAEPGQKLAFSATFPGDHPDPARARKTYDVTFDLVELKEKVLPDVDDELAKDVGDYETLDELKAALRAQGEARAAHNDEQELRHRLLDKLIEANPFDAPESLVELELDGRVEAAARDLYQRGIDPNRAGIDWRAVRQEQRAAAEAGVKATLILDKIAQQEGLVASEQEVDEEIRRIAEAVEKSPEAVRAQMLKDGSLERLKGRQRRDKAVDFVKQHAKLK
jgi:trigger factor